MNWNQLTFLESIANLKPLIRRAVGRTPSSSIAREIAACLQQGRYFFQAAESSPLGIRPLLLFYGTMAFSKALVISQTLNSLATLPRSHGLSHIAGPDAKIENSSVSIHTDGAFQRFNDVVAQLNKIPYHDSDTMPQTVSMPAARSVDIGTQTLSLRSILSRIPGLEETYARTFQEAAGTLSIQLRISHRDTDYCELTLWQPEIFANRDELVALVLRLRERFPALRRWRLISAARWWGKSQFSFGNVAIPTDEFANETLMAHGAEFLPAKDPEGDKSIPKTPFSQLLTPTGGSFSSAICLIQPMKTSYLSEYSYQYLGIFILSSVARYSPQVWMRVITRTSTPQEPSDDHALALLEQFMGAHAEAMPTLLAKLLGHEE